MKHISGLTGETITETELASIENFIPTTTTTTTTTTPTTTATTAAATKQKHETQATTT